MLYWCKNDKLLFLYTNLLVHSSRVCTLHFTTQIEKLTCDKLALNHESAFGQSKYAEKKAFMGSAEVAVSATSLS